MFVVAFQPSASSQHYPTQPAIQKLCFASWFRLDTYSDNWKNLPFLLRSTRTDKAPGPSVPRCRVAAESPAAGRMPRMRPPGTSWRASRRRWRIATWREAFGGRFARNHRLTLAQVFDPACFFCGVASMSRSKVALGGIGSGNEDVDPKFNTSAPIGEGEVPQRKDPHSDILGLYGNQSRALGRSQASSSALPPRAARQAARKHRAVLRCIMAENIRCSLLKLVSLYGPVAFPLK